MSQTPLADAIEQDLELSFEDHEVESAHEDAFERAIATLRQVETRLAEIEELLHKPWNI